MPERAACCFLWKACGGGKRAKPLRASLALAHLPTTVRRLFARALPTGKAPHEVGSWPSLRGLRGFAACRQATVYRNAAGARDWFYLHKRIIKPAEFDRYSQADEQQHSTKAQRDKVAAIEGSAGVPSALVALAEAAQLHRVGDRVDAVQTRQNQRQQDADLSLIHISEPTRRS